MSTGGVATRWYIASTVVVLSVVVAVADAQVLLDRVVARVNGQIVTLSDLSTALATGIVVAPESDVALATEQLIQRQLLLLEVERFPPPEPDAAAIDAEAARIRARVGRQPSGTASQAVSDERQIRQSARDTLKIRAYLDQRFGVSGQVSDEEARAYYASHPAEFSRDGAVLPFEQVEAAVRELASAARREATIDQWMAELRQRGDVIVNPQ
jgi:hypothetical protein